MQSTGSTCRLGENLPPDAGHFWLTFIGTGDAVYCHNEDKRPFVDCSFQFLNIYVLFSTYLSGLYSSLSAVSVVTEVYVIVSSMLKTMMRRQFVCFIDIKI